MTRDEILAAIGAVLAGLQVPISVGMPLGAATDPWRKLHEQLVDFGWADSDQYTEALKRELT
jgi:hypothetical protein